MVALMAAASVGALALARVREAACALSIHSNPRNASVWLDGRRVGETPLELDGISPGGYQLRLFRDGRESHRQYLELADKRTIWQRLLGRQTDAVSLMIDLKPRAAASVKVTSKPAGARVYVDGLFRGTTPVLVNGLGAGSHRVRLQLTDHDRWQGQIIVKPDDAAEIHRVLRPIWEGQYLRLIEKERKKPSARRHVEYYVDLAHLYVTVGRFEDAKKMLKEGYAVVEATPPVPRNRLYDELYKVCVRQYRYPPETEKNRIRRFCRALLERAVKAHPHNRRLRSRWRAVRRAMR